VSHEPPSRALPAVAPRGLSRLAAAAYVGIGATLFDQMIAAGKLPKPFRIEGRVLWDRLRLDAAIDELQDGDGDAAADRWSDVG
jgi:predicted DNA-binding transcriptional regulator AlpA